MSVTYVIPTKFTAIDGISPVVRTMSGNITGMAGTLNAEVARQERLFRKLTPGVSSATKQLLAYGSAGLALGAAGATGKAIMDNETALQSLSAVTGVVGDDFKRMRREVDQLARDTHKSSTDIAGSFEVVGSMMSEYLDDPKALREITHQGIILAKASRQELVPTLENLTSVMNQFELKANQATETVNRLTAGEIVGSLRTAQVAEQMQEFGAGAFAANVSLTESVALVEALARQMKTDKIGVGARNILTVMDSATGLARKARKELRAAGVDMHFLMDKTKSLSERLHELSKLSGNEKAITKVFGRENKTAAQVIFNQLGVFDQYVGKIAKTNQAEQQARTNSDTLANSIQELKNEWVNYFVVEDRAKAGLTALAAGARFLTSNMGTLIDTGVRVLEFYVAWKATIIATKAVSIGYNVVLGVQNVLYAQSIGLLEGNIVAQRVALVSKRALGIATQALAGDFTMLNAAMAANPAMTLAAGFAAVAGGLYLVYRREQRLVELYREQMQLDMTGNVRKQAAEVENLARKYYLLGNSIQKANAMAVVEKKLKIDSDRGVTEKKIKDLQTQLAVEKDKVYLADLFYGGGTPEVGKRADLANELLKQQQNANKLSQDNNFITQYTSNGLGAGLMNSKDLGGLFKTNKAPEAGKVPMYNYMGGDKKEESSLYEQLRAKQFEKQQKVVVEFKNAPAGMTVSSTAGVSVPSSF